MLCRAVDLFLQPGGGSRAAPPIPTASYQQHRPTASPRVGLHTFVSSGRVREGDGETELRSRCETAATQETYTRWSWEESGYTGSEAMRANKCFSSALEWETKLSAEEAATPMPILLLPLRTGAAPPAMAVF